MYKLTDGRVLLLSVGNVVLLDIVVNGGNVRSFAVGDGKNDLIHPVPRSFTSTQPMTSTVGHQQ